MNSPQICWVGAPQGYLENLNASKSYEREMVSHRCYCSRSGCLFLSFVLVCEPLSLKNLNSGAIVKNLAGLVVWIGDWSFH